MLVLLERFQREFVAFLITVIGRLATVTFIYRFSRYSKTSVISLSYNRKTSLEQELHKVFRESLLKACNRRAQQQCSNSGKVDQHVVRVVDSKLRTDWLLSPRAALIGGAADFWRHSKLPIIQTLSLPALWFSHRHPLFLVLTLQKSGAPQAPRFCLLEATRIREKWRELEKRMDLDPAYYVLRKRNLEPAAVICPD